MVLLAGWISDARFGLRQFRKAPRFFGLLLVLLVLGIGATTAMFSITWELLARPLPYRDPEQLLLISSSRIELQASGVSFHDQVPVSLRQVNALAEQSKTLQQIGVADSWHYSISSAGRPTEGLVGARISGGFFPVLGVRPLLGRLIEPNDDRTGAPRVVVVSAAVWRGRFASDPLILGKEVRLDARPYTVIGVAPEGFGFSYPGTGAVDLWTPLAAFPEGPDERFGPSLETSHWHAIARRQPGTTLSQVHEELGRISKAASPEAPDDKQVHFFAQGLGHAVIGDNLAPLMMRFGAVTLVFLTICANVSSLLSIQAEARRGEFAVRAAFGASRGRLARQVLTETLLLFLVAAPLSALVASLLVGVFRDFSVPPRSTLATVNVAVGQLALAFCLLASLLAGSVAAVLPALASARIDLFSVLQRVGAGADRAGSSLLRSGLVAAQVALAFTLSSGSGLAILSLVAALQTPVGFDAEGLVSARLFGLPEFYLPSGHGTELLRRVMDRIRAEPGVQSVAANEALPLSGYDVQYEVELQDLPVPPPRYRPSASWNWVTPGYFDTMHIPILRGRGISVQDQSDGEPIAVISQRLEEVFFRSQDPIGEFIRSSADDGHGFRKIVGVVADVRREGFSKPIVPEVYTPVAQEAGAAVLVARTDDPQRLIEALPALVASVDPALGVAAAELQQRLRNTLSQSYRLSVALGVFAGVALLLAMLGLYALVSYATTRRTRELGIRAALGSPPLRLMWLIMRGGLIWLGLGSSIGFLGAWTLGRLFALGLPDGGGFDVRVCAVVALALALAGSLASFIPARRAVRASPATALRYE